MKRVSFVKRVLVVAENASTRLGGEAILPFHYFRLLRARQVDAHLIVHARMRDELLELFPHDPERLHFVEDRWLQKLFYKLGKRLPRRLDEATLGLANQMLTQFGQRSTVHGLAVAGTVVHQPIPVSPRFPSLLAVDRIPLVAGPLNGGMEYPRAFRSAGSISRAAIALARTFSNAVNAVLAGKRRAAFVLVANERTRQALPSGLRGQIVTLPENGVDTSQWTEAGEHASGSSTRFVFIGRLVDWKALDIVIEAMRSVTMATLEVIGDGPCRQPWQALAEQYNLGDRIAFLGWKTQAKCAERLAGCCALVLPSVYECGGAVVLEAMAMRRPVIATAWGGPVDYLDSTCGILVEPASREALVSGFAKAMQRLMDAPDIRKTMGEAGRARLLREFDWDRKIDAILEIYELALTASSRA